MKKFTISLATASIALLSISSVAVAQRQGCAADTIAFKTHSGSGLNRSLRGCGPRVVPLIAGALRAKARGNDTLALHGVWWSSIGVRGEELLQAAIEVANDRSSSPVGRLVALSVLMTQYTGSQYVPIDFGRSSARHEPRELPLWCRDNALGAIDTQLSMGPDVPQRVAKAFDDVASDASSPPALRAVASCLRKHVKEVQEPVDPSRLSVSYRCDNTYTLVYADSGRTEIEYSVRDLRRKLSVVEGQEYILDTRTFRPFRLFANGVLVAEIPNGRKSCLADMYRRSGKPLPAHADTLAGWARPPR